ncbi:MAG: hypothetical protein F6K17_20765 [Okeania sp. SIO3C4]|nr:hypothetical protein [Okeania sp. SIO3C4]
MEKTFENNYFTFEVDRDRGIFFYTWKPTSDGLNSSVEDFLTVATDIVDGIVNSNCDIIIGDDSDFYVKVGPETQELMNKEMLQRFNGRMAIVYVT